MVKTSFPYSFLLVVILGLVLRLFVALHTGIINPDGTIYIDQARIVYYGLWDAIGTHGGRYWSLYPFLIAVAYKLTGNWIVAAEAVSIFFGTLTLIPLYFLSRRFFDERISTLLLLVFAVTPVFVTGSADIVRDPLYWFLIATGFYLFTDVPGRKTPAAVALSGLCFLLATLTRTEAFIFIIVPVFYIIFTEKRRIVTLAWFLLPLLMLSLIIAGTALIYAPAMRIDRIPHITSKLMKAMSRYPQIRLELRGLMASPPAHIPVTFFDNVRSLLWFIPLGIIFQNAMEAFYYPFFLVFIVGLRETGRKAKTDNDVTLFIVLVFSAVILLYLFILANWAMEHRWLALVTLPSFVFLGSGLEVIVRFLESRFRMKTSAALTLVCLAVLAFALPKDLKYREQDKIVFKEIGMSLARMKGNEKEIKVLTAGDSLRWITFYANLNYRGASYPDEFKKRRRIIGKSYDEFRRNLKTEGIQYLVWEKRHWPKETFDFTPEQHQSDFRKLGSWYHPDTGKLMLFKVL